MTRKQLVAALAVAAIGSGCLAGCARSHAAAGRQRPPARMEQTGHTRSVVLTPLGARGIGIKTAPSAATGKTVVMPFGALLYEPDGRAVAYVKTAPLTFTRYFITVLHISGDEVFVTQGLTAGQQVVTVGAEELLGVQNGVGVKT